MRTCELTNADHDGSILWVSEEKNLIYADLVTCQQSINTQTIQAKINK